MMTLQVTGSYAMRLFVSSLLWLLLCFPCHAEVFDATDDYMRSSFTGVSNYPFSISAWVYAINDNDARCITLCDGTASGEYATIGMGRYGTDSLYMSIRVGGGEYKLQGDTTNCEDSWNHVVAIWRSKSDRQIYINGASEGTDATDVGDFLAAVNRFSIGCLDRSSQANYWDGYITEVAIWSSDISTTATNIPLLATSKVKGMPLQIDPTNLEAYFPLDDVADGESADGLTYKDRSGNGIDLIADDGANNTGMTARAEEVLSYQ